MKCNIKCIVWDEKRNIRDWEITPEGRVWPCCFFGNQWDRSQKEPQSTSVKILTEDPRFVKQMNKDRDFNNLKKHSLDEILECDFYNNDIWHPGWNSDNQPQVCVKECSINPKTDLPLASLEVKPSVKR